MGGALIRIDPAEGEVEEIAHTGGRILGFALAPDGSIIAADAFRGLIAIRAGEVELLADAIDDDPLRFVDALAIASDGEILFTDASTRFGPQEHGDLMYPSVLEMLEQGASGRVLSFQPSTGQVTLIAQGLSFANGIVLSDDEQSLFVVETGRYRVWCIPRGARGLDLRADPGEASVLLDNLPGYPDNLTRGSEGRIWLGFIKPRSALVDLMADKPWLRRVVVRLPQALWPVPPAYGHVIAFNERGEIVADLQDPSGTYAETTGATEHAGRLYVHSLSATALGSVAWRSGSP